MPWTNTGQLAGTSSLPLVKTLAADISLTQGNAANWRVWNAGTFTADAATVRIVADIQSSNPGIAFVWLIAAVGQKNGATRLLKPISPAPNFTPETGVTGLRTRVIGELGVESVASVGNEWVVTGLTVGQVYDLELYVAVVGASGNATPNPIASPVFAMDVTSDDAVVVASATLADVVELDLIGGLPYWSMFGHSPTMRYITEVYMPGKGPWGIACDKRNTGALGKYAVVACYSSLQVAVIDLSTQTVEAYYAWPGTGHPVSCGFRPGSPTCYIGDDNGKIYPFNVDTRAFGAVINAAAAAKSIQDIDVAPDGSMLWALNATDGTAIPITALAGVPAVGAAIVVGGGATSNPQQVSVAPDLSAWVACKGGTRTFDHVVAGTGVVLAKAFFGGAASNPTGVAVSSDGSTVFGTHDNSFMSYWEAATGVNVEVGAQPGTNGGPAVLTSIGYLLFAYDNGIYLNPGSTWYCRPNSTVLLEEHARFLIFGGH